MRIQDLDQIPDDGIDMSQFLALDDPSQTFKMTLLQLVDALVAQRLDAMFVKKSGDEMAGGLDVMGTVEANALAVRDSNTAARLLLVRQGSEAFTFDLYPDGSTPFQTLKWDGATRKTSFVTEIGCEAQPLLPEHLTRRDFVESSISGAIGPLGVNKSVVLQRPSGAVAGNWYPVIVPASRQGACVSIDTNSGSGTIPMNNCAFVGFVGAGGWSDGGDMVFGHYHRYDGNEKSLASIHVPTEAEGGVVFYVHEAAFPVTVRYNHADVTAAPSTGLSVTQGTSVFNGTTNPDAEAGTKTRVAMIFGDGGPCSNYAGRLYGDKRKPTPAEIGASYSMTEGVNFAGKSMATILLGKNGKNYPITVPLVAGTYWISERGGENADRDYDFGVSISGAAPNFGVDGVGGASINKIYTM